MNGRHSMYFTRRARQSTTDFRDAYWHPKTDPDGAMRDPVGDRNRRIEDCREELAFINALTPGRIIEIGCGYGHLLSAIEPAWERHGVEPSPEAAEAASAHAQVLVGMFEDVRYDPESFDVVLMHHVIEHIEDPVCAVGAAREILKPGGWLIVATPNFDSACARRYGDRYRMYHDPTHISLFTPDSLRALLEDSGFQVDRVAYPFFETRYFTPANLMRLFDVEQVSPPFYGNLMTFYARKEASRGQAALRQTARVLRSGAFATALERARESRLRGWPLEIQAEGGIRPACRQALEALGIEARWPERFSESAFRVRIGEERAPTDGPEPDLRITTSSDAPALEASAVLLAFLSAID